MKILVLIKEVPDMEKVRFDSSRGVVDRSSAPAEINPFDESALQAALDIKRKYGAHVTAMTMGPPRAEKTLQDAYARGADDAVLLTDRAFGGSDTIATSRTLAAAIAEGDYDLILCGEKSVDGDTAQVGAETAALLGIPHAYYADFIEPAGEGEVRVSIENLCGNRQIRRMTLPALVGVTKNIGKLELPTVDRKLESLEKSFRKAGLADLDSLSKEDTGFAGSPTKVAGIEVPEAVKRESRVFRDDPDDFIRILREEFAERGVRV
ncbi:MAG: electron transfer flavoprotein subunit beta/FixA family protein [Emergencia sp.]